MMRTEAQVLKQIMDFARSEECIRAVIMNGSRVNPAKPPDIYCDYDIVFFVDGEKDFRKDLTWINTFGKLVIMQQDEFNENGIRSYIIMMQFIDGVRIDLTFFPVSNFELKLKDTLKRKLLDKDNILGNFPEPDESIYFTKKPARRDFDAVINEYLWVSLYTAKGLCRDQLSYTKHTHEVILRGALNKILEWYIGMLHNWQVNPGIYGKYFKQYLPEEIWNVVEKSYVGPGKEDVWNSLMETAKLINKTGNELAAHLGYEFPQKDYDNVMEYLIELRSSDG